MGGSSAELKNEWNYTSSIPMCLQGVDWYCKLQQTGIHSQPDCYHL
jgi:hypothetical protein